MRLITFSRFLFAAILLLAPMATTAKPARIVATPLLWEVKGEHASVYLFGSVHAMNENVEWYIPPVRERFERSANVWFELSNPDDKEKAKQSVQKHCTTQDMTQGLTPPEIKQLNALLTPHGMSVQQFMHMKKMLVITLLAVSDMMDMHYQPEFGIDMTLRDKALTQKKRLNGFETIDDQMRMICTANEAESLAALKDYIKEHDKSTELTKTIFDSWIKGDEKTLSELMDKDFRKDMPLFYSQMLLQRNQNWQPRIEKLIQGKENTFIIVGAAHLAGPDGIVAELKRHGFDVKQVDTSAVESKAGVQ